MKESHRESQQWSEWLGYINRVVAAVDSGKNIPLGPSSSRPVLPQVAVAPTHGARVLFCAPHPDDEVLSGALALRLRLECGARVTDVAVTLGSAPEHFARRRLELALACDVLGFDLIIPSAPRSGDGGAPRGAGAAGDAGPKSGTGLAPLNLKVRATDPQTWRGKVEVLARVFEQLQPEAVFAPHADDFNSTHIGTHHLVVDALGLYLSTRPDSSVIFIETEFWHEMAEPNLMVAVTPEQAAIQLVAAAEHGGEMSRNPYHLLHPCRFMNNVRRGSEVVGGQGKAVQPFTFAELYRASLMRAGHDLQPAPGGHILQPGEKATLDWLRSALTSAKRLRK